MLKGSSEVNGDKERKNILIVGARPRDREALANVKEYNIHFLDMDYNSRINRFNFDILSYLDEAGKIIKDRRIDGVFSAFDVGSLIAAALCDEFNLPGPSLEAVFLCYHKYYTRTSLNSPIRFKTLSLGEESPELLDYPFYFKAPCSSLGVLGFTIRSPLDLKEALRLADKELPPMTEPLFPFFKGHLDLKKFPLATENVLLIEEYLSGHQITIEGFVHEGDVEFTVVADTNFFDNSRLIDNFCIPTTLSSEVTDAIKKQAKEDVRKIGLDNTFFNAEYWCRDDGAVLIEINPRAATTFYNLYRETFSYDVYRAGLELCLGMKPRIHLDHGKTGGQFNIVTAREGKVKDLFNLDISFPFHTELFLKGDEKIRQLSEYGVVVGQMEIVGDTYDEIKAIADKYREKVIRSVNKD